MSDEEKQPPLEIKMDADTWNAIQHSRELTQGIFRPLTVSEIHQIGQVRIDEIEEFQTPSTNKPEAITHDLQEYDAMRDDYKRGRDLEALLTMNEGGWKAIQLILEANISKHRAGLESLTGTENDQKIANAFRNLKQSERDYASFKNTVQELMALPKPQLVQNEEKYPNLADSRINGEN